MCVDWASLVAQTVKNLGGPGSVSGLKNSPEEGIEKYISWEKVCRFDYICKETLKKKHLNSLILCSKSQGWSKVCRWKKCYFWQKMRRKNCFYLRHLLYGNCYPCYSRTFFFWPNSWSCVLTSVSGKFWNTCTCLSPPIHTRGPHLDNYWRRKPFIWSTLSVFSH